MQPSLKEIIYVTWNMIPSAVPILSLWVLVLNSANDWLKASTSN